MTLDEKLAGLPPILSIPNARASIRKSLIESGKRLVVIDDDPTGTQTVHGVQVYMTWSMQTLTAALEAPGPVFYLSTNSRSLPRSQAVELARELGDNLRRASAASGVQVLAASRSDSTLRGHFPSEVTALVETLYSRVDGILLVPAFFEAGRYTIDDVHWVDTGAEIVPAHRTEFARDPDFGFLHGDLREWVEEKTGGATKARDVLAISLPELRIGGAGYVSGVLDRATGGVPIVANAACYEDLEVLALGVVEAERRGKRFVYRTAASFVKARGGIEERPLLTRAEVRPGQGAGIVLVGSYVAKTTRQLELLLESGWVKGIELRPRLLAEEAGREREIAQAVDEARRCLDGGVSPVVFTSRVREESDNFLETGNRIMAGLCETLRRLDRRPAFIVAKGGITSIELARAALQVTEAEVLGQVERGVPVRRLSGNTGWDSIPYVVFPGNVGDEASLRRVVGVLQGREPDSLPRST